MESLSAVLQPYKGQIAVLASVTTIGQFFSGVFICKDVYKKRGTEGISAMPFVGGFVVGILMIKYSLLLQDEAMLIVNVAAVALNSLYIVFYYTYSKNRMEEIHKPMTFGSALIAVLLGYVGWEDPSLVEYRYSLIVTVLMLLLMGSPLIEVNDIIKKKDSSSIPFPIIFSGTIVTFLWLLYGIILQNEFMVVQNFLGLLLCCIQLGLCWLYPKKSSIKKD